MELSEYQNIFENEASHFFYRVNHQILLTFIERYFPNRQNLHILDAGCGTGLLLKKLSKFGHAQGVDISSEAIKFCRMREANAQKASLSKLPFAANTFDLITSVDVLYHLQVKDDIKALRELRRVLKPGGILLLRVPANKWLKLHHDQHVHTRQRYTTAELAQKIRAANLHVLKLSYLNSTFLLLAGLKYLWERTHQIQTISSGVKAPPAFLNALLIKISELELWWLQRSHLPFGLGAFVIAEKT